MELTFRGEKVKVKRQFFRDDKGRGYSTTEQDEDAAWYALRAWCEKKGVSLYDLYPREEWSEEDERIREIIILALIASEEELSAFYSVHNITRKECTAWLEKQKEQKPEGVYVDCTEHPDWYGMPQKTTTKVNGEPIPTENTAVDIPCTGWSEEDNIGWDEAFACVIRAEKSAKNEEELQNAVTAEKWLKEIKFKYYVNPNKQEWSVEEALNRTYEEGFNDGLKYRKPVKRSDEDKKMSDWLIGLVNANIELSFKDKVNLTRWLEHLTIEKELPKNDKRIIDAIMIGYQDKDFSSSQIPTPIGVSKDEVIDWLKSLRPQPYKEVYQAAKHDLAIKFMNYLDENRPEGKMCLSNGGCEDIDKAFKENDWAKIMRYVEKYRPHWKPSEEQMRQLGYVAEQNKHNMLGQELMTLYNDLKKLM